MNRTGALASAAASPEARRSPGPARGWLLASIAATALGAAACGPDETSPAPTPEGSGGSGIGGAGGSGIGGAGGSGGIAACEPADGEGETPCDACVLESCCSEARACGPDTPCGAFVACARDAGCLGRPDATACGASACPDAASSEAVLAYEALSSCVRGRCGSACGL